MQFGPSAQEVPAYGINSQQRNPSFAQVGLRHTHTPHRLHRNLLLPAAIPDYIRYHPLTHPHTNLLLFVSFVLFVVAKTRVPAVGLPDSA